MILKDGKYFDGGIRNRMLILLMYQIIKLHDSVYMFEVKEDIHELVKLKFYLTQKLKKRAMI